MYLTPLIGRNMLINLEMPFLVEEQYTSKFRCQIATNKCRQKTEKLVPICETKLEIRLKENRERANKINVNTTK